MNEDKLTEINGVTAVPAESRTQNIRDASRSDPEEKTLKGFGSEIPSRKHTRIKKVEHPPES